MKTRKKYLGLAVAVAAMVSFSACLEVREGAPGEETKVDIRTPIGDLSVRTDLESPNVGLPVYPGSRPVRRANQEHESAEVSIGAPFFGLEVVAASFESDAAPQAIVDFYKNQMKTYGNVTECRGNVDFKGRRGLRLPVCKKRLMSPAIQLVVGTEAHHRLVSVEPRPNGSEFAVVSIQTRNRG